MNTVVLWSFSNHNHKISKKKQINIVINNFRRKELEEIRCFVIMDKKAERKESLREASVQFRKFLICNLCMYKKAC